MWHWNCSHALIGRITHQAKKIKFWESNSKEVVRRLKKSKSSCNNYNYNSNNYNYNSSRNNYSYNSSSNYINNYNSIYSYNSSSSFRIFSKEKPWNVDTENLVEQKTFETKKFVRKCRPMKFLLFVTMWGNQWMTKHKAQGIIPDAFKKCHDRQWWLAELGRDWEVMSSIPATFKCFSSHSMLLLRNKNVNSWW